ncbi:MAG: class I SAM-dependent methyltransferase [Ruminococcus sp.]|nr:class I SAM-dependent methyltransferase [Ruminococcus sp.]
MRIAPTKRITEKIMQLLDIKPFSSMVNSVITHSIKENSVIPGDVEALRTEAARMNRDMQAQGSLGYSDDEMMLLLMVESMIAPYLSDRPDVLNFYMNAISEECRIFDVEEFMTNPYIKNIDFHEKHQGDYELLYHEFMPYEVDLYSPPKRLGKIHIDIPRVSCFTHTLKYPAIGQTSIKSTWMSVTPNEVYTMADAISNAKGKVLTLGCGMGYFAYMASLKDEVDSITIVEIEQDIIDLFETHILPQFQHKEKINIVKADAIEYMQNLDDGEFDYCFADIWIGIEDIAPYFSVKEIGRKLRKTKVNYWIEESFAIYLSQFIWTEILESFSKAVHADIPDTRDAPINATEERVHDYVHRLLKKVEITTPDQIDYYLTTKNIIALIDKTKITF